jgi:antitoxin component of MazEF toxin-antitoxin module
MIQKVLKVGSSAAVTIPKKALAELGIAIGDEVSVHVDAQARVITTRPAMQQGEQEHITARTLDFVNRYRADLEALKDK